MLVSILLVKSVSQLNTRLFPSSSLAAQLKTQSREPTCVHWAHWRPLLLLLLIRWRLKWTHEDQPTDWVCSFVRRCLVLWWETTSLTPSLLLLHYRHCTVIQLLLTCSPLCLAHYITWRQTVRVRLLLPFPLRLYSLLSECVCLCV